jgi:two-component system, cell cycle response regulator CpdR
VDNFGHYLLERVLEGVIAAGAGDALLVHVETAVDFDLQGVDAAAGAAVAAGGIAAGIGSVAGDSEALRPEAALDPGHQAGVGAGAEPVAEHDIGQCAAPRLQRGHRVAVDQQGLAVRAAQRVQLGGQVQVVGVVDMNEAFLAFGAGQEAAIDRLAPGADAGQAAETGLDPRRGQGAGAGRAVMEHGGIEFVGIAVEVHDRAAIAGGDEAGAEGRGAGEQLIDEGIFGAAYVDQRNAERFLHAGRIVRSGMRAGEQHRRGGRHGGRDIERGFGQRRTCICRGIEGQGGGGLTHHSKGLGTGRQVKSFPVERIKKTTVPALCSRVIYLPWPLCGNKPRFTRHEDSVTKILLAEDDDSMRGFLAAALRRAGHDVQDYADGEGALQALEREVFDLLLTDIVMPGLDGIELARRGAELDPAMKIVFITGFAAVALSSGAPTPAGAKVLSKPFHLREIVEEVDKVMAA